HLRMIVIIITKMFYSERQFAQLTIIVTQCQLIVKVPVTYFVIDVTGKTFAIIIFNPVRFWLGSVVFCKIIIGIGIALREGIGQIFIAKNMFQCHSIIIFGLNKIKPML